MNQTADKIGVGSGMIVCIDPCLLFTPKEWAVINEDFSTICERVVEALGRKIKIPGVSAACFHTKDGDGCYEIQRVIGGMLIREA